MKKYYFLLFVSIIVMLVVGCDSPSQKAHDYTIEHKIAILNAGTYVDESDISVKRFRYLLSALHDRTGYDQEKIGDQLLVTRNYIRDNFGREITILQIAEAAYRSKTVADKSVRLEDYLTMYVVYASR